MLNESSKYKVGIVDDHALFACSLEKLINSFSEFETSFNLRNGVELQKKLEEDGVIPDIILLDINMPVFNGFETAEWLYRTYPRIKFLALTMEDDEISIIKMLRHGAKGYMLKDIEPEYLKMVLNEVVENGYYHSEKVSEALLHSIGWSDTDDLLNFKEHEITLIKLASSEMTYKEIAERMNLSPKTIDGYRQELFKRLNVKNRVGLVMFGIKYEIIKL